MLSNNEQCYWDADCLSLCCNRVCSDIQTCVAARAYPRPLLQQCMINADCQSNCCGSGTQNFQCGDSSDCNKIGKKVTIFVIMGIMIFLVVLLIVLRIRSHCTKKHRQNTSMIDTESIILNDSASMDFKVVKVVVPSPKAGGKQRKLKRVAQKVQPLKDELAEFLNEELSTRGSSILAQNAPADMNWDQALTKNDPLIRTIVSGPIQTTEGQLTKTNTQSLITITTTRHTGEDGLRETIARLSEQVNDETFL